MERAGLLLRLDEARRCQEAARIQWGAMVGLLGDGISVSMGS
jgi:hypothetical protein